MAKINRASGNDVIAVQVGEQRPASERPERPADTAETSGTTTNIRSGNARVGRQAGTITGGLTVGERR
jgi:hypothetical protein